MQINSFRHLKGLCLGPFPEPQRVSEVFALAGPNGGGKSSILELFSLAVSSAWSLEFTINCLMPTSSFEIELGLSKVDLGLLSDYVKKFPVLTADESAALEYLMEHKSYFRSARFVGGDYEKNRQLFDSIHQMIVKIFRKHYQRSPGMFLQSDRGYRKYKFRRELTFEYAKYKQNQHYMKMAFSGAEEQYTDMYDFLVQQRYHYYRKLGKMWHDAGVNSPSERPPDPLVPYNELLRQLFPSYIITSDDANEDDVPTRLMVEVSPGVVVPFEDLSSGEKEVFFLLAFFIRQNVENSIVIIDEPELHLHPEMSRLLVRNIQMIRPGSQIWLATHNYEVVDEIGPERTLFVARSETGKPAVKLASEASEARTLLRSFFGFSGFVGVGKKLVFLEGNSESTDRRVFSKMFPESANKVRFIPISGVTNLQRVNELILSIMEDGIGYFDCFLIRDRDYLSDETIPQLRASFSERMFVLNRYHIENYLLDEHVLADVLRENYARDVSSNIILETLISHVEQNFVDYVRDMCSYRLNMLIGRRHLDFGKHMTKEIIRGDDLKVEKLREGIGQMAAAFAGHAASILSHEQIDEQFSRCFSECELALKGESWKSKFPGRPMLYHLLRKFGVAKEEYRGFVGNVVRSYGNRPERIAVELREINQKLVS